MAGGSIDTSSNTVEEIVDDKFLIKKLKTTQFEIDLNICPVAKMKMVLESGVFPENFQKYNPIVVLRGYYDENEKFHSVERCTIAHMPNQAVRLKFVLLLENDAEGDVASNLAQILVENLV
jgi:predicted ATP-grasp superfamily ATP-dependent carboligase